MRKNKIKNNITYLVLFRFFETKPKNKSPYIVRLLGKIQPAFSGMHVYFKSYYLVKILLCVFLGQRDPRYLQHI